MMRRRPGISRSAHRGFSLLLLLSATLFLLTWRAYRQMHLNRTLIAAIHDNDAAQVRSLLAQKADPNAQELFYHQLFLDRIHGQETQITSAPPALIVALYQYPDASQKAANTAVIRTLLKAGADANVHYEYGITPLMRTVRSDKPELVRILLESGADVQAKDTEGANALMQAAGTGNVSLISLLLDYGTDVNSKDNYGCNALRFAILYRQVKSVKRLIERNIDINARDNAGLTALTIAKQQPLPQIVSLLQKAGAKE